MEQIYRTTYINIHISHTSIRYLPKNYTDNQQFFFLLQTENMFLLACLTSLKQTGGIVLHPPTGHSYINRATAAATPAKAPTTLIPALFAAPGKGVIGNAPVAWILGDEVVAETRGTTRVEVAGRAALLDDTLGCGTVAIVDMEGTTVAAGLEGLTMTTDGSGEVT
jgi:hypothetical protein